ncbi:hypothetical protein [Blastomonas sp.]|uniref:hypothetical protein n=1 Tax=Blastomonas sp. TaxID=1909299 RepID=UPI0035931CEC
MAFGKLILGIAAFGSAALFATPAEAQYWGGGPGYGRDGPAQAVNRCTRAAQADLRRWGRFGQVTDIRRVRDTRFGYRVRGRVVVEEPRGFRTRVIRGSFDCFVNRGRVRDLRFSGLGNFR